MNREKEDLIATYRAAVRWGMYEEAARIQRRMIGLPPNGIDPDLVTDLRVAEQESRSGGFMAALRTFFARPRNA